MQKRRRREYRQIRRAAFDRPEPGFSLYEGRTRGKRMRYTYDEDDSFMSDDTTARRSTRQSGRNTPMETGPTFTASGRQIRAPKTGEYGESLLSREINGTDELAPEYSEANGMASSRAGTEDSDPVRSGRATRSAGRHVSGAVNPRKRKHIEGYNDIDDMSEEDEASGGEWDSDKNEADDEDENMPDADDEDEGDDGLDEEDEDEDEEPQSLVVKLKVPSKSPAPSEVKNEDVAMANGAATPVGGEDAKAGAVNGDVPTASGSKHLSAQPGSSPAGPSGYPTPASTSFLPTEQKPVLAPAPAVQLPSRPPLEDSKVVEEHVAPPKHLLAPQSGLDRA